MTDFKIKENAQVSLHDCRTNKILYEDGYVSFFFPNGFYHIKDSGKAESSNTVMKCRIIDADGFCVYIYRKSIFGKTVREDWTKKFVLAVNSGKFEFEFVYTYRAYRAILFKGYVWTDRKPYHRECEIEILTDEIEYM